MNRNMSAPDKVYSVFKMGSASTDQHRRQARWQMSLLRHKSPYRTTLVPPSLILCFIKQQKLDLGQTWAHDCIYVMLEKNYKVFTSTPRHMEKIVHCERTMTWDSFWNRVHWHKVIPSKAKSIPFDLAGWACISYVLAPCVCLVFIWFSLLKLSCMLQLQCHMHPAFCKSTYSSLETLARRYHL